MGSPALGVEPASCAAPHVATRRPGSKDSRSAGRREPGFLPGRAWSLLGLPVAFSIEDVLLYKNFHMSCVCFVLSSFFFMIKMTLRGRSRPGHIPLILQSRKLRLRGAKLLPQGAELSAAGPGLPQAPLPARGLLECHPSKGAALGRWPLCAAVGQGSGSGWNSGDWLSMEHSRRPEEKEVAGTC